MGHSSGAHTKDGVFEPRNSGRQVEMFASIEARFAGMFWRRALWIICAILEIHLVDSIVCGRADAVNNYGGLQ